MHMAGSNMNALLKYAVNCKQILKNDMQKLLTHSSKNVDKMNKILVFC